MYLIPRVTITNHEFKILYWKFQINLSDLKMIKETLSIVMIFLEVVFVLFY